MNIPWAADNRSPNEVLAVCALSSLRSDRVLVDRRVREVKDWEAVARVALGGKVSGLFLKNVEDHGLEGRFRPGTLAELERRRHDALRSGLCWTRLLRQVVEALAAEKIVCVPLKGLSLLLFTYQDESLRETFDVDLLIRAQDFTACRRALVARGYRPRVRSRRGVLLNHGQECEFLAPEGGEEIDVHYRLFSWTDERYIFKIDSGVWFDRAVPVEWRGVPFRRLLAEDELCYLLLCALRERDPLGYLTDAAALLGRHAAGEAWDPERIVRFVRRGPLERELRGCLRFLREAFGVALGSSLESFTGARAPGPSGPARSLRRRDLARAENVFDKLSLGVIYLKWQMFKRLGMFRPYFLAKNNPVGIPLVPSEDDGPR